MRLESLLGCVEAMGVHGDEWWRHVIVAEVSTFKSEVLISCIMLNFSASSVSTRFSYCCIKFSLLVFT